MNQYSTSTIWSFISRRGLHRLYSLQLNRILDRMTKTETFEIAWLCFWPLKGIQSQQERGATSASSNHYRSADSSKIQRSCEVRLYSCDTIEATSHKQKVFSPPWFDVGNGVFEISKPCYVISHTYSHIAESVRHMWNVQAWGRENKCWGLAWLGSSNALYSCCMQILKLNYPIKCCTVSVKCKEGSKSRWKHH